MIWKTHLAIGLAVALYFLPFVNNEFIFFPVVVVASMIPDIDSAFSVVGKKRIFKPIQLMTGHRGILHTYTFCMAVSILFAFFVPVLALPFFLGYSFHLFADSFTVMGIKPFWPFKMKSKGVVKTGGPIDKGIFVVFVIIDVVLSIMSFV